MGNRVTVFILGPAVGPRRRTSDAFLRVCTLLCVRVRACASLPHCPRFLCLPRSPLALVPRLWPPVGENRGVCEAGRGRAGPAPKRAQGCAGQGSRWPGGGSSRDPRARPPEPKALGPEGPAGRCRRRRRRGSGTWAGSVHVLDGPAPAPQDDLPPLSQSSRFFQEQQKMNKSLGPVSFKDVAVDFTQEEWQQLDPEQKITYRDVMLENYSNLVSVGYHIIKPDVISKLEQGEEPWIVEGEFLLQSYPDEVWQTDDLIERIQEGENKPSNQTVFIETLIEDRGNVPGKTFDVETNPVPSGKTAYRNSLCDSCEKCLASVSEYISSDGSYARMKADECSGCGKSLLHIKLEKTHPGDKAYELNQNGKPYTLNEESLYQKIHILEKPFEYIECQKAFQKDTVFVNHMEGRPYKWNGSEIAFLQMSGLTVHQASHLEMKPYECSECGKSFCKKSKFIIHQRTHTGEKPYECNQCGKSFCQKGTLTVHQRTHTGEKPYECNECGKNFYQKLHLIQHQRTHSGEKPYECSYCGKSFCQKTHLTQHQRTHSGERPYVCHDCGKTFSQKSALNDHQKIHTGEKPYECSECGKTFCQNSALNRHQRTHTGEKAYECYECGKCFSQMSYLTIHHRIHSGEKPFECNECGKAFSRMSYLTVHYRTHSGEKPYECTECGKKFYHKSAFNSHQRIHRRGNMNVIDVGRLL
ncbi:zinc finger protein 12 isoform X3 [Trachypithecus francoisi]|uniref:zinc finger protein 12 isoform X3 n=1 Tax=Trachypithecus francoisi TaxID=54180 RepID=UPI00141BCFD4|nr:zinc finger protein 12 isoform X3 [Trachypithecus francoisi]